jgi:DNA-directed RNA polymerase specialized sigma24 family protein
VTPAQAAARDAEVSALLERTRSRLRALLNAHRIRSCDAQDLLQEVFLSLLRHWEQVEDPESYLVGALRRTIAALVRRRAREPWVRVDPAVLPALAGGHCPQTVVECRRDARRLLARLPPRAARLVALRYGEELSSREIAATFDVAETGVRTLAGRQLRRLRRLAENGQGGENGQGSESSQGGADGEGGEPARFPLTASKRR